MRLPPLPRCLADFLQQLQQRIFELEALVSHPSPFELHTHEHVGGLVQALLGAHFPDAQLEVVGPLSVGLSARQLPAAELLVRDHTSLGQGVFAVLTQVGEMLQAEAWVVSQPAIMCARARVRVPHRTRLAAPQAALQAGPPLHQVQLRRAQRRLSRAKLCA